MACWLPTATPRRLVGFTVILLLVAAACSDDDPVAEPSTVPETTAAPTTSTPPPPVLDLTKSPFVMFAPVPPRPAGAPTSLPDGSVDYHDLFVDGAPWQKTIDRIDAFKLHSWMIRHYLTDEELVRIAEFLDRNGVALIIEAEPLDPPDPSECSHSESFEGPYEIENAVRLRDLGITVAAYAIEQPFSYGHKLESADSCNYSLDRVLDEVRAWSTQLREVFPDVQIGSIEALWDRPNTTPEDYALWIDAYTAAMGEPPAFQHVDVFWSMPDWPETLRGIEEVVESRGVPFGVLYNGFNAGTNDRWIEQTIEHIAQYEAIAGGTPGHVVIQSWYPQPDRLLPETDRSAMTHLVGRYFGARTQIVELAVVDAQLVGRVVDEDGDAIEGLMGEVSRPASAGDRQRVSTSGTVPADAVSALILIRVNFEDSIDVGADATVHAVDYAEDGVPAVVPNGTFAGSLDSWGVYDDNVGSASFLGDDGDGAMRLAAGRGERILVDGPSFPVVPGAEFTFGADITVGDASSHGKLGLAFLNGDGIEFFRTSLDLRADSIQIGSFTSRADGRFAVPLDNPAKEFLVTTSGGLFAWPASATLDLR